MRSRMLSAVKVQSVCGSAHSSHVIQRQSNLSPNHATRAPVHAFQFRPRPAQHNNMAPPRLLAAAVLVLALLACSRAAPCTIGDGMADWVAADASGPELAKLAAPAAANYIKTVMEADAKTHGFDCSAAAKSVAAEVTAACSQPDKVRGFLGPCRPPGPRSSAGLPRGSKQPCSTAGGHRLRPAHLPDRSLPQPRRRGGHCEWGDRGRDAARRGGRGAGAAAHARRLKDWSCSLSQFMHV